MSLTGLSFTLPATRNLPITHGDRSPWREMAAPRLAPAAERVSKRTGRKPRTVTADRGYSEKSLDDSLCETGVRMEVPPARAVPARPDKPRNTVGHSGER